MNIKEYVAANFTFDPQEIDKLMEPKLQDVLRQHTRRDHFAPLIPPDAVSLQDAYDWLNARGWQAGIGTALSGVRAVILNISDSIDRHIRESRVAAPAPATFTPAPWERAMPLPSKAPDDVVAARNKWYFNVGIYAPLEILMRANEPDVDIRVASIAKDLAADVKSLGNSLWVDEEVRKGFAIIRQPNHLRGIDALLFGILPGRSDSYDIVLHADNVFQGYGKFLRRAFYALGAYIAEVYPELGNTKNAQEDGLDYRVLASLAGHGIDPTDDDTQNEALALQWAECLKDTLVLGAFAALQRIGELINGLFPEKAEGGAE